MQFQLTVNFVALVIAFVSALTKGETPLTVIQLLWVNLIMDALGALGESCTELLRRRHLVGWQPFSSRWGSGAFQWTL